MIHLETITPDRAGWLLEMNTSNRPITENHVKNLAAAMTRSEWKFNGDSIRIGANNTLLDGQHRLLACIRSGVSFKSLIITDIEPDVFETIDVGRKRSGADTFALMGLKNCTNLAASLRVLVLFESGRLNHFYQVSNTMLREALERNEGIKKHAAWVGSHKDIRMLIQPSVCTVAYYLASQLDEVAADEFFSLLKSGASLSNGSPVLALRSVMIRQRMGSIKSKIDIYRDLLLILKAFDAFCAGKEVRSLVVGDVEAERLIVSFGGKI